MSNLICGRTLDLDLLHPTDRMYRSYAETSRVVEPQGPVHVSVRVRPSGDSCSGAPWSRRGDPDVGGLPIGAILDCYM
jgi:hypothetical protein